ncbi:MAG: hypothetical protein U0992_20880 [Planctomycetaceae bacterium]
MLNRTKFREFCGPFARLFGSERTAALGAQTHHAAIVSTRIACGLLKVQEFSETCELLVVFSEVRA